MKKGSIAIVVPSWNGKASLATCLDSLLSQSLESHIIVVENGSTDGSAEFTETKYPQVELIKNAKNLGFAGGVNTGIRKALAGGFEYVALFNNDAMADKHWLEGLVARLGSHPEEGIATCKFMDIHRQHLDSTGDWYTNWGLPYPRGRGEPADNTRYDSQTSIFAASGGASLYRAKLFEDIGLFDEDFFAYYEDVDLSFRAQLAGWKVAYVPAAIAYHQIGATSGKIKGFTTYQTMKNLPLLLYKNVPRRYLYTVGWRFMLAHSLFFLRAASRGQGWVAIKGDAKATYYLFKKHSERKKIQASKKVTDEYIWGIITHDLPPNAHSLRTFRAKWRRLRGKPS